MSAVQKHVEPENPIAVSGDTLIQAIVQASRDPATNMDKMERLFAMHKEIRALDAESAFNAAMARTQELVQPVARDAENRQTNSRYATLAAICKAVVPIYSANGLSVSFDAEDCPKEGWYRTVAIVSHAVGHTRRYHYDLPLDDKGIKDSVNKTKVHAMKSTTSYGRNALLCMIFNISTQDEDDDGNAASISTINDDQAATLQALMEEVKADKTMFMRWLSDYCKVQIQSLEELPANSYKDAVSALNAKRRKGEKK